MGFFKRISTTFKTNENTTSDKAEDSDEMSNQTMVDKRERPVTTKQQIATHLSQRDPIEKLNLMEYSFNALTHAGVKTVGELLKLVESGELRAVHGLRSTSILEIEVKLTQLEIVDNSEVESYPNAPSDQNDVPLSREVSIEKSSLTQSPPNQLHVDRQAVREVEQQVESGESATISESDANVDTMPDQNDASLSQEDATEEPSLPQHSPAPPIHTESQTVGEGTQHIESGKLQTSSEGTANTNATPDQNDVPPSREDSTQKIRLTRDTLNRLKQTDIRTVGELLQWVESGKSQTIPEGEADTNEALDQNDVSLSREDSTEEQSPTEHSPNQPIRTDSQAVGEGTQHVESSEISTTAEDEADMDATSDQNDVPLSREDSIEKLRLTQYALNRLKHTDIQTVEELLQWVESDTTPALGQKSISKIKERLAQGKTLDDSETEANANTTSDQNDVSISQEDSVEEESLTEHTDLRTVREGGQQVESSESPTISEGEANTDAMPDQNDMYLSRGDAIERLNLSRHSFNVLTRIGIRTVGEVLQLFELARLNMIHQAFGSEFTSEIRTKLAQVKILDNPKVEKNSDAILDQDDVSPSREDSIEKSSLTQYSPNPPIHTESQTVIEIAQQIESGEIQTISEGTANTNTILEQNDVYLSRGDAIEKLNLSQRSLKALKRADIRMVGELLQLVELGRLRAIRGLGRKSISEIEKRLVQVRIHDNYTYLSKEDSIGQLNLRNRSFNAFTRVGIQTIGEVLKLTQVAS